MIILQNTVISDDVRDNFFVCNLEACKGACCVEGDLGAPLEEEELAILETEYASIKPFSRKRVSKLLSSKAYTSKIGKATLALLPSMTGSAPTHSTMSAAF